MVRVEVLGSVNSNHNHIYNPNSNLTLILTVDCQKQSQSGLCSKPTDLRAVGDIALIPSICKSERE